MKKIIIGNVMDKIGEIESGTINCIITSPPYYAMRDYGTEFQIWDADTDCEHEWKEIKTRRMNLSGGMSKKQLTNAGSYAVGYTGRYSYSYKCSKCKAWKGELGQEPLVEMYIKHLIDVFNKCKRVLRDDGALWINIADTYIDSGKMRKGLYCVPERLKIGLIESGWICRMENIWHVLNKMPTSVKDRFNVDYEKMFMFVKQPQYYFKQQYVKGKNGEQRIMRTVWSIPNGAKNGSNTASFPKDLIKIPIMATCPEGGTVMDLFAGSGTVCDVAEEMGRNSVGIELREDFINN